MKLFGSGRRKSKLGESKFAEFDTCMRARRQQRTVIELNTEVRRSAFEALVGKRPSPRYASEIRDGQSIADFKGRDENMNRMGLSRFFRPIGGWFKGGNE